MGSSLQLHTDRNFIMFMPLPAEWQGLCGTIQWPELGFNECTTCAKAFPNVCLKSGFSSSWDKVFFYRTFIFVKQADLHKPILYPTSAQNKLQTDLPIPSHHLHSDPLLDLVKQADPFTKPILYLTASQCKTSCKLIHPFARPPCKPAANWSKPILLHCMHHGRLYYNLIMHSRPSQLFCISLVFTDTKWSGNIIPYWETLTPVTILSNTIGSCIGVTSM